MSLLTAEILDRWAENAKRGLLCAIVGCNEPVEFDCSKCTYSYCETHKTFHYH